MKNIKGAGDGVKILGSVLSILLCVVLIGSVIRIVFGGGTFTFSAFLNQLQNVPQVDMSNVNIFTIGGDWGIFEGLRRFLNSIMSIFNFGVWICVQLINCLGYILFFVNFIRFA